jgi:hypothetical protein
MMDNYLKYIPVQFSTATEHRQIGKPASRPSGEKALPLLRDLPSNTFPPLTELSPIPWFQTPRAYAAACGCKSPHIATGPS